MIITSHFLMVVAWLVVSFVFVAKSRWTHWIAWLVGFAAIEVLLYFLFIKPALYEPGIGAAFGAAFLMGPAVLAFLAALMGAALGWAIHFWRDSRSF